ncbi:hypothetical protein [Tissierella sp. P1]
MLGVEIKSTKRKEMIQTILNRFGVRLVNETLSIECSL